MLPIGKAQPVVFEHRGADAPAHPRAQRTPISYWNPRFIAGRAEWDALHFYV